MPDAPSPATAPAAVVETVARDVGVPSRLAGFLGAYFAIGTGLALLDAIVFHSGTADVGPKHFLKVAAFWGPVAVRTAMSGGDGFPDHDGS